MDDSETRLRKASVDVVVVEDEAPWAEKIEAVMERGVREWVLHRARQFTYQVHAFRAMEPAMAKISDLLVAGHIVYATLDLRLPRKEADQVPEAKAGQDLLNWCIDKADGGKLDSGGAIGFCVISGDGEALEEAEKTVDEREPRRKVRPLRKQEIFAKVHEPSSPDPAAVVIEDLRSFVRRNLDFVTYPLPDADSGEVPVWLGRHEELVSLLRVAEDAALSAVGGVRILLSDGAGYETDWFRLVCHLRQVDATVCRIDRDIIFSPWKKHFDDPPKALLLAGVDRAVDHGVPLNRVVGPAYFKALAARQHLAFFQFPYGKTLLEVKQGLDPEEDHVLQACAREVRTSSSRERGIGDRVATNDEWILRFPPYEDLKRMGVVQNTLRSEVLCKRDSFRLPDLDLDPEVQAVMEEIRWDRGGGLSEVRKQILVAFSMRAAAAGSVSGPITIEEFPKHDSPVRSAFAGPLGLRVRGRRIYDSLRTGEFDRRLDRGQSSGVIALGRLEGMLELYESLERLAALKAELQRKSITAAGDGSPGVGGLFDRSFTRDHFETLEAALEFFRFLFRAPAELQGMIESFRPHSRGSHWESHFPGPHRSVRDPTVSDAGASDDHSYRGMYAKVFNAVQWPFGLPLPFTIGDYLGRNGLTMMVNRDLTGFLDRNPDVKAEWAGITEAVEKFYARRVDFRERQRLTVEAFARENVAQPLAVHLADATEAVQNLMPNFQEPLQGFIFFNAYLAISEYIALTRPRLRAESQRSLDGTCAYAMEKTDLGPSAQLLQTYVGALQKHGLQEESILRHWTPAWPDRADGGGRLRQTDALRIARQVASWIREKKLDDRAVDQDEDRRILRSLADLPEGHSTFPPADWLRFLTQIRNSFIKRPYQPFWSSNGVWTWDLLARFAMCTTRRFALGAVSSDGSKIVFWARDHTQVVEAVESHGKIEPGRTYVFSWQGRPQEGLFTAPAWFPVDSLIRLNQHDASIWVYYKAGNEWMDITSQAWKPREDGRLPNLPAGPRTPWLPSVDPLEGGKMFADATGGGSPKR